MTTPEAQLGDRVVLLETAVAYLVERQDEVRQLVQATERLSDSTLSVERALRTVGDVRHEQEKLARTVHSVSRRVPGRKRLALIILALLALAALAGYGVLDRIRIQNEITHLQTCEQRGVCYPNTHQTSGGPA